RRLPHVYPEGKWLFVTWCLHGSLPAAYPPPKKASAGEAFVWIDRYLDKGCAGPLYLNQEPIANLVIASLYRGIDLGHYDLGPFVLMANHVHVLIKPMIPPPLLLRALKGATAREANRLLGQTGETFWQKESYDHWGRSEEEFAKIARYIENNPVRAGIVSRPEDYRWSSASVPMSGDAARTSAYATKTPTS
ncbi:MAG: transposase, partial [Acidobacteriota bacterium]|nr:transposase [Acidobacteriota bacterium]